MDYPDGYFYIISTEFRYGSSFSYSHYKYTCKVYNSIGTQIDERYTTSRAGMHYYELNSAFRLPSSNRRHMFPTSYVEENLKSKAPQLNGYTLEKVVWGLFSSNHSTFSKYNLYHHSKTENAKFAFFIAGSSTYNHYFKNGFVQSVHSKLYDPNSGSTTTSGKVETTEYTNTYKETKYSYIYKNNFKPTDCCLKALCKPNEFFLI